MDSDNIHLTAWYREPTQGGLGRSKVCLQRQLHGGRERDVVHPRRLVRRLGRRPRRCRGPRLAPGSRFLDLFGVAIGWVRPTASVLRNRPLRKSSTASM